MSSSSSLWPRKHGRLESFLQRLLNNDAARVTWYEPCIVEGAVTRGKPYYCYVVLADGILYLIDSPPKHVRAMIPIGDVLSIQLVPESPLFLKGDDRENAQHIKITYCVRTRPHAGGFVRPFSRVSSATPSISENRASSVLSEALSLNSDPGISYSDTTERRPRRMKKLFSLSWPKKKPIVHQDGVDDDDTTSSNWDYGDIRSLTSMTSTIPEDRPSSKLSLTRLWPFKKISEGRIMTPDPALCPDAVRNFHSPVHGGTSKFLNGYSAPQGRPSSTTAEMLIRSCETPLLVANNMLSQDLSARLDALPRSRTVLGNYADHGTKGKLFKTFSDATDAESMSLSEGRRNSYAQDELHVYVLTPQSSFFKHLNTMWHNKLLKDTLDMDYSLGQQDGRDSREYSEQVLQDLYRKLCLKTEDNYVQIRQFVERIRKDIVNNSTAKKLFWKDPNLFPAMANKVRTLTTPPESLEELTIGFTMDKIKACTSLIHMLTALLQETEVCPGRGRHLTSRNGQRTKELLTTLVTMPAIPTAYRDVVIAAVTSYNFFSARKWETMMEAPLIRSVAELTNVSVMAIYQYFQLALQGNEMVFNQKVYGVEWMVRIIAEVKTIDSFISRLMCQLLLLASPMEMSPLTPCQAALLHQQMSLLLTLVTHSSAVALHVSIMFGEEIRYFVASTVIERKVDSEFPIHADLLNLVNVLRQTVLGNQTDARNTTQMFSVHHSLS